MIKLSSTDIASIKTRYDYELVQPDLQGCNF